MEANDDILHLIETSKTGITTRDLWKEICTLRMVGTFPHVNPLDREALMLTLFHMRDVGKIELTGDGWAIAGRARPMPGPKELPKLFD